MPDSQSISRLLYLNAGHRRRLPPDLRGRFRSLDQFIRDLVSSATERLLIVSPYIGPAGMETLRPAIAVSASAGAWIRLVTGDLDEYGGRNRAALAVLVRGDEGHLIRERLRVLTTSRQFPVLLHAKIVIADGSRGYLGSANLSGHGLDTNFEVGVSLPHSQARALDDLIYYMESQGMVADCTDKALG